MKSTPHKLVFASDSFKGTLSATQIGELLTETAHSVFGKVECISIPMADGGEGTTDAVISAVGGERIEITVHDPLMRPRLAHYGIFHQKSSISSEENFDSSCIIEMAEASGLPLLQDSERNPLLTTTYGTGEMILDAVHRGIRHIFIAIGGSATNDGGIGCLQALGAVFSDKNGEINANTPSQTNTQSLQTIRALNGKDLVRITDIDLSAVRTLLKDVKITVLCDVKNPLCGPTGASYIFGPQKCSSESTLSGSQNAIIETLETGMLHYQDIIFRITGKNADEIEGTGAAGGLGAALILLLGGKKESGIETVLRLTDFDNRTKDADLVITGEGKIDGQSCFGKVVYGVATHCRRAGIPAVAIVGQKGNGAESMLEHGLCAIIPTADPSASLEYNLSHAESLYRLAASRFFESLKP